MAAQESTVSDPLNEVGGNVFVWTEVYQIGFLLRVLGQADCEVEQGVGEALAGKRWVGAWSNQNGGFGSALGDVFVLEVLSPSQGVGLVEEPFQLRVVGLHRAWANQSQATSGDVLEANVKSQGVSASGEDNRVGLFLFVGSEKAGVEPKPQGLPSLLIEVVVSCGLKNLPAHAEEIALFIPVEAFVVEGGLASGYKALDEA